MTREKSELVTALLAIGAAIAIVVAVSVSVVSTQRQIKAAEARRAAQEVHVPRRVIPDDAYSVRATKVFDRGTDVRVLEVRDGKSGKTHVLVVTGYGGAAGAVKVDER